MTIPVLCAQAHPTKHKLLLNDPIPGHVVISLIGSSLKEQPDRHIEARLCIQQILKWQSVVVPYEEVNTGLQLAISAL